MSEDAIMKFILLVEVHFPRPKFNGDEKREALWMRSMREILSEYEPEVLAKAAENIVRTRDPRDNGGSMFPKPSECIAACRNVIRHIEMLEIAKETEGGDWRQLENHSVALPTYSITPVDVSWEHWMVHLKGIGRHDLAHEAESKKLIRASRRWPSGEVTIFEPNPTTANLLASLPPPRVIPN